MESKQNTLVDPFVFHKISYGLYLINSKKGDKFNGQIANTLFQVTANPPQLAVAINKSNLTHEFIEESKVFTASILSREIPMTFIGNFGYKSGRDIDKFKNVKYKTGVTGAPIVTENTIGYFEVEVNQKVDVGSHTLFIGTVVSCSMVENTDALTYDYYHQVKKGISPKTATITQLPPDSKIKVEDKKEEPKEIVKPKETTKMQKYKCVVCGYIYDPANGDPDSGIEPGTAFENIPENWVCPICGADKSQFEPVND